jgi:hypothetical protein
MLSSALLIASGVGALAEPLQEEIDTASPIEEITVRGERSIGALRKELEMARERVYAAFNEHNGDNELDVHCAYERRTGSRMPQRVCRPAYAEAATSQAGKEFTQYIQATCSPPSDVCLSTAYEFASAVAQAAYSRIPLMDLRIEEVFQQLAVENPDVAAAILEYYEKEREYAETRRRRRR